MEHACSMASLSMGETVMNVARGIDCYSFKMPMGVCAGIAPFNFPIMIPLWMFPIGITLGNTYVLKPSEKVPGTSTILARMCNEIGLPPGVLNVVHGGFETVKNIVEDPHIKTISFVGGQRAGEYIHTEGARSGKRV